MHPCCSDQPAPWTSRYLASKLLARNLLPPECLCRTERGLALDGARDLIVENYSPYSIYSTITHSRIPVIIGYGHDRLSLSPWLPVECSGWRAATPKISARHKVSKASKSVRRMRFTLCNLLPVNMTPTAVIEVNNLNLCA